MSDGPRTIEQVRGEIATERRLLAEDMTAVREDVRTVLPYAAGGLAAFALLTKGKGARLTLRLLRLLR